MGRQPTDGLNYFSFDVDFFENPKVKSLRRRHGNTAVLFYIQLLCDVYRKGYYRYFDSDYKDELKERLGVKDGQMQQIMSFLCERSLLDGTLLTSDTVITSLEIQRRFQQAIKQRVLKRPGGMLRVDSRFWLLDESETEPFIKVTQKIIFPEKNAIIPQKNKDSSKKKATKEIKGKESKVNNPISAAPGGDAAYDLDISDFDKKCTDYLIQQCAKSFERAWIPKTEAQLIQWQRWITKLREKYESEDDIWAVLVWVYQDPFWTAHIRSTKTFMERYETLYLRRRETIGSDSKNKFLNLRQSGTL